MGGIINFPRHLDITPSITPKELEWSSHGARSVGAIFGGAAQREAIGRYGIAGRVWEAAYALCLYVHPPPNLDFDPPFAPPSLVQNQRTFLELGAGTGIVSYCVAEVLRSGQDSLIVTDLPEVSKFSIASMCLCSSSATRSALYWRIIYNNSSRKQSISIISL